MIIFVILFTLGVTTVTLTDTKQPKETSKQIYERKLKDRR